MKPYRRAIIIGLVPAVPLCVAACMGYGMHLCYMWPVVALVVFVFAARAAKYQPSFRAHVQAFLILVVLCVAGPLAGHWARRIRCLSICRRCEPMLALIQKNHSEHGFYPEGLRKIQGFDAALRKSGLRIDVRGLSRYGFSVGGINNYDALICVGTEGYVCVVPVTKKLLLSFTRFYVYASSNSQPSWTYDKILWALSSSGKQD